MKRKLYQFITLSICWLLLFAGSCNNKTSKITEDEKQEVKKEVVIKDLDTETFKTQLSGENEAILVDVRTPEEVAEGYIQGAINIDFRNANFMHKMSELDKNKAIYLYCRSGGRSGQAAAMLKEAGFTEVYNLLDGFNGWKEAENDFLIPPK